MILMNLFKLFCVLSVFSSLVQAGIVSAPVGCTTYGLPIALCSGHGECRLQNHSTSIAISEGNIPGSQCVCKEGWTGRNDWVDMDGHDCGTNLIAIRVIWAMVCISVLAELSLIIYKFSQSYIALQTYLSAHQNHLDFPTQTTMESKTSRDGGVEVELVGSGGVELGGGLQEENHTFLPSPTTPTGSGPARTRTNTTTLTITTTTSQTKWDIFLLWCQWPIVKVCFIAGVGAICELITCFIRMSHPEWMIGINWWLSLQRIISENAFIFANRVIIASWLDVRSKVLRFTEQNEQAAERAISYFRKSFYVTFIIDFCRSFMLILIQVVPEGSNLFFLMYMMLQIVTIVLAGLVTLKSGQIIESILVDGLEMLQGTAKVEREKILNSVRTNLKAHRQSIVGVVILSFLNGWWPFLRARQSYVMIQVTIIGVLISTNLNMLHPPKINTFNKATPHAKEKSERGGERGGLSPRSTKTKSEDDVEGKKQKMRNDEMPIKIEVTASQERPSSPSSTSYPDCATRTPSLAPMTPSLGASSPDLPQLPPIESSLALSASTSMAHQPLMNSRSESELREFRDSRPIFNPYS